jgi:hypothetical protein
MHDYIASPELIRILQAMSDANVGFVIQGKTVCVECSRFSDMPSADKFNRELTEAHRAEILAVFGPGDKILDPEFLQKWCRPAVADKLSRFWPDLLRR